MMFYKVKTSWY